LVWHANADQQLSVNNQLKKLRPAGNNNESQEEDYIKKV